MAVDRKADHVGNHGGAYTDIDGMRKQFTYIDHDRHTSRVDTFARESDEVKEARKKRLEDIRKGLKEYNNKMIAEILALPAVNAVRGTDTFIEQALYQEFVKRSVEDGITWNEPVLRAACDINTNLCRDLHMRVWKHTIKEDHWFVDMSHEDILSGKWKELT